MNEDVILDIAREWMIETATIYPRLRWLDGVSLVAFSALIDEAKQPLGDDHAAGEVTIRVTRGPTPTADDIDHLRRAVLTDHRLGGRAKRTVFERASDADTAGRIIVWPLRSGHD